MKSPIKDNNRSRIAGRARAKKTLEKYEGKIALMETWENIDPSYYRKLKNEAHKLRATLIVKGILFPITDL